MTDTQRRRQVWREITAVTHGRAHGTVTEAEWVARAAALFVRLHLLRG